ncbi:hypothetical protein BJP05_09695 [Corynebacterium sp. NML98-0116]|uniref:Secreted protein n=1 Tax=Corynebacterium pseudogenitalium TaxID=38303 RepID=A0ABD4TSE5_9CORY|nr:MULTISPECIES: hypothetical protein [Corynebacterium]AOX06386.1 hypothetical protein BJP05_09695 [Corynebacterium sp. NML98-0116]MCQ4610670.1 hypothetical protein [Corynebacterium sp. CCUG 61414]MCQ4614184.1 hypothetical protein [Corynebacterium pseudogenitalium]
MNRTSLAALAVAGALVVATPAFASTQTSTPSAPATTTVTVTPTVTATVTPTVAPTTTNTAPTDPAMALSAGDTSNVSTPALVLFIMGILTTVLTVIEKLPLDQILPKR